jgi:hypothetical protein
MRKKLFVGQWFDVGITKIDGVGVETEWLFAFRKSRETHKALYCVKTNHYIKSHMVLIQKVEEAFQLSLAFAKKWRFKSSHKLLRPITST